MKRRKLIMPVVAIFLFACGGGNQTNQEHLSSEKSSATGKEVIADHQGKQLIAKSDCSACHSDKSKIVGPSYTEIANKYENTEENQKYLVKKIIEGGFGVWGDVPMTPHPQLSQSDTEEMVKYILSLKQN